MRRMTLADETNLRTRPSRANRLRAVRVSKTNRSAISNGNTLLPGVDGRSPEGRRYRDLFLAFADELGGVEGLSEADRVLVKHCVAVAMHSEALQVRMVRGEHIGEEELTRLGNSLARAMAALRARQKPKSSVPTIAEIAARHRKGTPSA